jgi:hypothetical protein
MKESETMLIVWSMVASQNMGIVVPDKNPITTLLKNPENRLKNAAYSIKKTVANAPIPRARRLIARATPNPVRNNSTETCTARVGEIWFEGGPVRLYNRIWLMVEKVINGKSTWGY